MLELQVESSDNTTKGEEAHLRSWWPSRRPKQITCRSKAGKRRGTGALNSLSAPATIKERLYACARLSFGLAQRLNLLVLVNLQIDEKEEVGEGLTKLIRCTTIRQTTIRLQDKERRRRQFRPQIWCGSLSDTTLSALHCSRDSSSLQPLSLESNPTDWNPSSDKPFHDRVLARRCDGASYLR